ncbi:flagellar biosynthetic protein FliO [Martelella mediterranea]|uniref:Flagellar biosynthesis protein FliO n=1 Tax=Martelella mediterranea TaxID=293089 RepID=A0A4R3NST0_9HYPH|nr:flagellar biosynthesis protein FliO [Martelella mediterranea]
MGESFFGGTLFNFPLISVAVIILALIAIGLLFRHRPPSPFIKGGKNRRPRLYVVDAAAVDARRRVILVRRDNVEHLVMIGGPNDILLETKIPAPIGTRHERTSSPRRPVSAGDTTAPRQEAGTAVPEPENEH